MLLPALPWLRRFEDLNPLQGCFRANAGMQGMHALCPKYSSCCASTTDSPEAAEFCIDHDSGSPGWTPLDPWWYLLPAPRSILQKQRCHLSAHLASPLFSQIIMIIPVRIPAAEVGVHKLGMQGLMRRLDWKEAVRLPLAMVPGGTSGALAFNSGIPDAATGAYAVCKGCTQVCIACSSVLGGGPVSSSSLPSCTV